MGMAYQYSIQNTCTRKTHMTIEVVCNLT